MKKRMLAVVAATGFALSAPSHANLVFNGGFELGNVIGGEPTNFILGWTTSGEVRTDGSITEIRHSGNWAAQFSQPEGRPGDIAQNLATIAGHSYELTYWLQGYRGDNGTNRPPFPIGTFFVSAGDFANQFVNPTFTPWQQFTFDFIASSDSTRLEFTNRGAGFSLDDVSVVEIAPIPEPSPSELLGLGTLALLLARSIKIRRTP